MTDIEKLAAALTVPNNFDLEERRIVAHNLLEQIGWMGLSRKEIVGLAERTHVVVPVEPTKEMLMDVGTMDGFDIDDYDNDLYGADQCHIDWWKAMIKAAQGDL